MNNSAEDVIRDRGMSYEERRIELGNQCIHRRRVLMKGSRGLQEFDPEERVCSEECNNHECKQETYDDQKKETVQDYLERHYLRSDPHFTSNS